MPGGVARSDDATTFLPNTEANLHHPLIVVLPRKRAVEIKLAFAVIGGRQDDVPIRPIAHGATRTMLVAPVKAKERAKAKVKARRAKVRRVKEKARAREADLAHPAVEQRQEPARQQVGGRVRRTRKRCV